MKEIKKHVIFTTITMGGGGSERAISILANQLVEKGAAVTILMIAGDDVAYELDSRITLKQVGNSSNGSLKERIRRIGNMRKVFKNHHSANIIAMGTVASIFTLIADFGLKNHVIISERNNPNRMNGRPYSKKMKMIRDFLYKRADMCVFQTNDARLYFPFLKEKHTRVIPNSISPDIPKAYQGERKKEVVTAGRLIPEKNQKLLLRSFAEFHKEYPEYCLKIFGSGSMEQELRELIKSLHLEACASLIPFTDKLHEEIGKSGIYVSSSDGEGISNAILEALALGIPTIATDCPIGGSKMCIQNQINGILIGVGDEKALTKELCHIAKDRDFAKQLSQNALKVRETFSQEKIFTMWEEVLQ